MTNNFGNTAAAMMSVLCMTACSPALKPVSVEDLAKNGTSQEKCAVQVMQDSSQEGAAPQKVSAVQAWHLVKITLGKDDMTQTITLEGPRDDSQAVIFNTQKGSAKMTSLPLVGAGIYSLNDQDNVEASMAVRTLQARYGLCLRERFALG